MRKSIPYFLALSLFGVASCHSDKSEKNEKVTAPQNVTADTGRTISAQSEPDSLKGSVQAIATDTIGATTITINYYSPAVRGRVIWGGLVPFDNVWVTGAHKATNIAFNGKVRIGDAIIEPGKYGLFTIPGKEEWTIILNNNWNQHLADDYTQNEDVVRVNVKPQTDEVHQERLRYVIERETASTGAITVYWERLKVSLPIESLK